jgi:hypothetical protein
MENFRGVTARAVALARTIEWERAIPPAVNPAQFDYAAEHAVLEQLRGQRVDQK